MAFFGENELSNMGNVHIEAAEGYSGTIGAQLAMAEGFQNDYTLFEAALKMDFREMKMVKEGASEEEIASVQEGALSNFWAKIKEFVRKLIEKIKGIFKGFIAKFEAWMGKDGKAFFEKYKRDIVAKDVDGLKVRYSKPNHNLCSAIKVDVTNEALRLTGEKETTDLVEEYLGRFIEPKVSNPSKSSFRKDYHDACFDSEEKGFEVTQSNKMDLISYISGKDDPVKTIKDMATKQEKSLNSTLKIIEKYQKAAVDHALDSSKGSYERVARPSGSTIRGTFSSDTNANQKEAAYMHKQVSAMQEALNMCNAAALTEIKFAVAQSRRIAAAIVAYRGKKHEDTDLLLIEAEQDAAEYECLSALEAVC